MTVIQHAVFRALSGRRQVELIDAAAAEREPHDGLCPYDCSSCVDAALARVGAEVERRWPVAPEAVPALRAALQRSAPVDELRRILWPEVVAAKASPRAPVDASPRTSATAPQPVPPERVAELLREHHGVSHG